VLFRHAWLILTGMKHCLFIKAVFVYFRRLTAFVLLAAGFKMVKIR